MDQLQRFDLQHIFKKWNLLAFVFLMCSHPVALVPVNVALNKKVTAFYTCGVFGREAYTTVTDAYGSVSTRPSRSCVDLRASNQSLAAKPTYPPEAMVDGSVDTWWQSTSRSRTYYYGKDLAVEVTKELEAMIDFDLLQEFLVESIKIQLGDALTPQKASILKSLDGKTFTPWIFAVSNSDWCESFFSSTYKTVPETTTDTICVTYEADDKPPGDGINLGLSQVPDALKEWTRARYVKVKFYDMMFVYPFNSLADSYNHYSVSELTILAECPCNGQQSACNISSTSGMYECVCGGNTRGRFCESCLPLFNQLPFEYGKPCVECNCFGHATVCFYKESVALEKQSLDKQGNRTGGGVCSDCQNNTAGVNCEKCVDLHYRPLGVLQTAENPCIPCLCNISGSTVNPNTNLVDCVMNSDTNLPDGKLPGDCYCKSNVNGSKCDVCKTGFYNLQQNNPDGCSACECATAGTVGASSICLSDSTGQCTCKINVQGRACDTCKDGFYNLTSDKAEGCTPCNCDVGGSENQICDKVTGQCVCSSQNLMGRRCDSIQQGYYYPSAHSIYTELEDSFGEVVFNRNPQYIGFSGRGYAVVVPGSYLSFLLSTPINTDLSNNYIFIIMYRSTETTNITFQVQAADDENINMTLVLPVCVSWCQANTTLTQPLNLNPGPNLIILTVNSGQAFLDKFVALPVEFLNVSEVLQNPLPQDCDFLKNKIPTESAAKAACQRALFSVTMFYWNSPLACACDITGSASTVCDIGGGQCPCKEGVVGRTCSRCSPDHYGFSIIGCSACNCDSSSSLCDSVTGQCQCPENTIGRQCEFCTPNHWNWTKSLGCQDCGCHTYGSVTLQCNSTSGVCGCKIGWEGTKCDACQDGSYRATSQECVPCLCDQAGSMGPVCNKTSGQCACKENTVGQQCNACEDGAFGIGASNSKGCLECVCMGVTSNCASAGVHMRSELLQLVNNSESGMSSLLQLTSENSTVFDLPVHVDINVTSGLVIYIQAELPQLFWKLPDSYVSNLLSVYGSDVVFTVNYVLVSGKPIANLTAILIDAEGDKLSHSIVNVTHGHDSTHRVTLKEENWLKVKSSSPPTRGEFLKALHTAEALLIPASFGTLNQTTRLSKLELSYLSESGPVNPSVEQCVCGDGYIGRSCEACATGYKRDNVSSSEYFGLCVPCQCNGHATNCDPDTGECQDCQNNTAGPSCEECKLGYHGDASTGCIQCPCYQPRVINETCHSENTSGVDTVVCDYCREGYDGDLCDMCEPLYSGNPLAVNGACLPCICNGNSATCDNVTGICNSCSNNTTGNNCQQCLEGFYGNASQQMCQECHCDISNSNSSICDPTFGQCSCLYGVGGRICDSCLLGYWGFNNDNITGCQHCGCVEAGSLNVTCNNDTGQCPCKPNTSGMQCNACNDGYYGLPLNPCQACDCNLTGAINASCNQTTGQCQCRPGVGGRRCDQCLPFFLNFTTEGCQECGLCQVSLGNEIKNLIDVGQDVLNKTTSVLLVQSEGGRLDVLSQNLNQSLEHLGLAGSNVTSVTDIVNDLNISSSALKTSFEATETKLSALSISSEQIKSNSSSEASRLSNLRAIANNLTSDISSYEDKITVYLLDLRTYNNTASLYFNRGSAVNGSMLTFLDELSSTAALLAQVQNTSEMDTTNELISHQATTINSLDNSLATSILDLDAKSGSLTNLSAVLDGIFFSTSNIENTQAQTQVYKSQAESLNSSINEVLSMAEKSNADSATNLTAAKLAATNTNIIYSSNAAIVMPARDTLPFPTGVTNYGNGVTVLNSLLSTIPLLIDSITPDISQSEAYVVTLGDDLKELNSTYQNITSVGKLAVATMKNFDNVIRDINSSVAMATNAEQLIKEVQGNMSGTALDLLQEQYGTERNISEELRNTIMELDYQPQVLQNAIDTAMSRLDKEVSQWQVADAALSTLTTAALNLNTQIKGSQINSVLKVATQKVQNALATAESVAGSVTTQESTLHQKQGEIEIIQKDIIRAQDMQQSVQQALKNHQTEDDAFKQNVSQASSLLQKSDQSIKNIDNKIKDLEIKMEEAEVLLNQLRQPLNFDGNLSLQIKNPEANRPHLYDELVLDMRKPGNFTDGVVVFVDNPTTAAELQVGVASNKVFFEFNNGAQIVRVSSRAEICDVCWARVAAFRYAAVGYLTVTMISTGAVVADSRAGLIDSNARNLTLTSNLYVGSLPKDLETSKVTNRWFLGCLHNIVYQSQDVSLWTTSLTTSNPPKCCQTPPALPAPFTTPGLSFDGFGHITLYPGRLLFSDFKQFSLELRTFSTEATLFTVSSPDKKTVFSITVSAKAVVWTILNDGVQYKLVSPLQIATGKWAQILAMRDGNEIRLAVRYLDDPDSLVVASQTTTFFQLNRLDGRNLIFGLNSETLETGYGKANFAGCVRNISITTSTETHRPTFPDSVLESSGVKTDGCYLNVVEGLGFTSEASYAQFPTLNQLQQMKTLEFDIITTQSNGMLLYISGEGTMRFLYMAVIGGNVILVYRQNDTGSVISSGYYISDGQKHTVRVDFLTFRVALKVDDIYVEAGQTLSLDYLSFPANAVLILGGVPPTVELPPDCPVKQSIIGGFSRLVLNSGSIAFSEMNFTAQMDITLGGIIAPSGSTTAPLVNVSQMVICASKPVPSLLPLSDGVLFSGNDGLVWNSVIEKKIIEFFEGSFTMNIDLAVYKADGVLLYVADLISSPTTYFTIYIMDGILHQAMRTSLGTALDVKLSKAINDGQKHQIHLMRNNDHVALSFDNSTKDYVNNNQNGNVTSNFTFPTTNQVYLGALGTYNIMTSPLPQSFQSQPTKAYFAGAIYNLEIQDTPSTIETLHFSNLNRNLFGPVAKSVYYGISLTGVNSYLPLGVASTWDSLTIEMTLTTVSNSGLLMLIYENANKFLAMDLKNNQIRIHLPSSSVSGGQPLTITLDTSSNLCNGVIHSLQLQFVNSLVKLTADNQVRAARSIPDSYKLQALSNAQLFVGGVTGQFQGLPQELTTASLSACIMSVSLSNQGLSIRNFDPTQYVLTNSTDYGASYSCPH